MIRLLLALAFAAQCAFASRCWRDCDSMCWLDAHQKTLQDPVVDLLFRRRTTPGYSHYSQLQALAMQRMAVRPDLETASMLAAAQYQLTDFAAAAMTLDAYLQRHPHSYKLHMQRAAVARAARDYSLAASEASKALALGPGDDYYL